MAHWRQRQRAATAATAATAGPADDKHCAIAVAINGGGGGGDSWRGRRQRWRQWRLAVTAAVVASSQTNGREQRQRQLRRAASLDPTRLRPGCIRFCEPSGPVAKGKSGGPGGTPRRYSSVSIFPNIFAPRFDYLPSLDDLTVVSLEGTKIQVMPGSTLLRLI